jgi:hypothetical protein
METIEYVHEHYSRLLITWQLLESCLEKNFQLHIKVERSGSKIPRNVALNLQIKKDIPWSSTVLGLFPRNLNTEGTAPFLIKLVTFLRISEGLYMWWTPLPLTLRREEIPFLILLSLVKSKKSNVVLMTWRMVTAS